MVIASQNMCRRRLPNVSVACTLHVAYFLALFHFPPHFCEDDACTEVSTSSVRCLPAPSIIPAIFNHASMNARNHAVLWCEKRFREICVFDFLPLRSAVVL